MYNPYKLTRKILVMSALLGKRMEELESDTDRLTILMDHFKNNNRILRLSSSISKQIEDVTPDSYFSEIEQVLMQMVMGLQLSHAMYQDLLELIIGSPSPEAQRQAITEAREVLHKERAPEDVVAEFTVDHLAENDPEVIKELRRLFEEE